MNAGSIKLESSSNPKIFRMVKFQSSSLIQHFIYTQNVMTQSLGSEAVAQPLTWEITRNAESQPYLSPYLLTQNLHFKKITHGFVYMLPLFEKHCCRSLLDLAWRASTSGFLHWSSLLPIIIFPHVLAWLSFLQVFLKFHPFNESYFFYLPPWECEFLKAKSFWLFHDILRTSNTGT